MSGVSDIFDWGSSAAVLIGISHKHKKVQEKLSMSTKKKVITVIIGIEAVIIAALMVFLFYINSDTVKVNRQLKLAQQYLLAEDYEQAIAAFSIVIEIDPRNKEAYLGMAEAYAATDDLKNAVKILERASKKIESEEVLPVLEVYTAEIEQREQEAQKAATDSVQPAETAPQTSEPGTETLPTGLITRDDELKDDQWKQAYIGYIQQHPNTGIYTLFYMDNDNIPELLFWDGDSLGSIVSVDNRAWKCYESENFTLFYEPEYESGACVLYVECQNFVDIQFDTACAGGHTQNNIYKMMEGKIKLTDIVTCKGVMDESGSVIGESYWCGTEEISEADYKNKVYYAEVDYLNFSNGHTAEEMINELSVGNLEP